MNVYDQHLRGLLLTGIGVIVLSPDALLIRMITADRLTLLFWRGLLLSLTLILFLSGRYRQAVVTRFRAIGKPGLIASLFFAGSTMMFVTSIRLTAAANTLVIISAAPLLAALFSRLILKERIPFRTWVAAVCCLLGILVIFAGSLRSAVMGDLCAGITACLLGGNFVLLRHARRIDMVPALSLSGIIVAMVAYPFATPFAIGLRDGILLLILGGMVLPLAFGLIIAGPRFLPAPEVSLIMQLETIFGTLWVWLVLREAPGIATLIGGSVVVGTLAVHSSLGIRNARRSVSLP